MSEPVKEFINLNMAYDYLYYWKEKLYLNDWIIKLKIVDRSDMPDIEGDVKFVNLHKAAVIRLIKWDSSFSDMTVKFCHEVTLVHELLHLKYMQVDYPENMSYEESVSQQREHQLIEEMARSLIMAKYSLSPDWFKNFYNSEGKSIQGEYIYIRSRQFHILTV